VDFFKKFFYLLLDLSGIGLGIFLMIIGWYMAGDRELPSVFDWIIFALGVAAFFIHASHYLVSRRQGSDYFYTTRERSRK